MNGQHGFPGQGWPSDTNPSARAWYHFETGGGWRPERHHIVYGGVFQDRHHRVQNLERSHHVGFGDSDGVNNVDTEGGSGSMSTASAPPSGRSGRRGGGARQPGRPPATDRRAWRTTGAAPICWC